MADPIHARELVMEDSLYSRGMLSTDQLVNEERELEQDRKGKGRAFAPDDDRDGVEGEDDGAHDEYGYGGLSQHQHRDEREAGRRARSRSQSARYDDSREGNSYGDVEDDADDDGDGYALSGGAGEEDGDSIPLHGRREGSRSGQRRASRDAGSAATSTSHPAGRSQTKSKGTGKRARSASVLGGLLEKNTLPEDANISKAELRRRYIRRIAVNAVFILAWYTFSTLISLYNKWMFSPEHYGFGFPLFVTSCHMLVQFVLCSLVLSIFPSLRPARRPEPRGYATKVVPCGLATGLDIGLSNLSLKTITLSFYTMCKSSVLGFVLLFAFVFRLEKPTLPLIGVITIITAGVIMMVSSETQFHLVGMMQVLTASCLSGLRWSLTQILLDKESMGMNNPFATLFWLAPIMGISLALCSIFIEGWFTVFSSQFFDGVERTLLTMAIILLPGVLAFSMNVAEFGLIQRTSVVTLSVAGIFKEVATIGLATLIFHDELTPINISGLCVALFGIGLYNYMKYRNYKAAEKQVLSGKGGGSGSANGHGHGHGRPGPNDEPEAQQFALVGEEDLLSSDDDEDAVELDDPQRRRVGLPSNAEERAGAGASVHLLPSYAETHAAAQTAAETAQMEKEVKRDQVLVDLDAEEHELEEAMRRPVRGDAAIETTKSD